MAKKPTKSKRSKTAAAPSPPPAPSAATGPVAILLDDHRNPLRTVALTEAPPFHLSQPDGSVWYHVDNDPDTGAWRYQRVK